MKDGGMSGMSMTYFGFWTGVCREADMASGFVSGDSGKEC